MDTSLVLVTLLFLAALVLVTIFLSRQLVAISRQSNSILLTLISDLQERNQSLLNQVRALDPMTLMNLQTTTTDNLPLQNSLFEEYLPHDDESEFERFVKQQGSLTPLGEVIHDTDGL